MHATNAASWTRSNVTTRTKYAPTVKRPRDDGLEPWQLVTAETWRWSQ
jgi:hypothetical protein